MAFSEAQVRRGSRLRARAVQAILRNWKVGIFSQEKSLCHFHGDLQRALKLEHHGESRH